MKKQIIFLSILASTLSSCSSWFDRESRTHDAEIFNNENSIDTLIIPKGEKVLPAICSFGGYILFMTQDSSGVTYIKEYKNSGPTGGNGQIIIVNAK